MNKNSGPQSALLNCEAMRTASVSNTLQFDGAPIPSSLAPLCTTHSRFWPMFRPALLCHVHFSSSAASASVGWRPLELTNEVINLHTRGRCVEVHTHLGTAPPASAVANATSTTQSTSLCTQVPKWPNVTKNRAFCIHGFIDNPHTADVYNITVYHQVTVFSRGGQAYHSASLGLKFRGVHTPDVASMK